ncbi:hypothetical protein N781_06195 [Pontibacillus halophilus JSM 076056 = DSM 19796]|uniref:Uncharacterized protein n=1 Tax=Pontibacillus halophilus JSM 076056 = DSM 19796 TaxID=1385510 RepID=A0A0A5GG43_9BACI|nr:hypothetical protein [Pontibacillus halophilus]KGX90964.1 hypothetical protein N781_06195 [Pontibacillus halophilus JSM 076056 = DSM 19796]
MKQQLTYKCIVITKDRKSILLDKTSEMDTLSFPSFIPDTQHVAITNHINGFLRKNYNIETNVLRIFKEINNIRIYEIEILDDPGSLHKNFVWVDISNLLQDHLNTFDQYILTDWVDATESQSLPWVKVGWRNEMEKKVTNMLGDDLVFEQMRSWERSALFKIYSKGRNFYLKTVPDVFKHEVLISEYLYQRHPTYVPEIFDVNQEEQWYIMEELNGPLLGQKKRIEYWREALFRLVCSAK